MKRMQAGSRFGLAVRRLAGKHKDIGSIPPIGCPARQTLRFVDSLVTVSLTVSETLKWLSSLPILMQESYYW